MSEHLHRLIYFSHNRLVGEAAQVEIEIRTILAASRANNARDGVTGALVFTDGVFGQVLEGPLAAIEATFERIQQDERHGDVTLLDLAPVAGRSFATWSMAFVGASGAGTAAFGDIAGASGFDATVMDGERLFQILDGLVRAEGSAA